MIPVGERDGGASYPCEKEWPLGFGDHLEARLRKALRSCVPSGVCDLSECVKARTIGDDARVWSSGSSFYARNLMSTRRCAEWTVEAPVPSFRAQMWVPMHNKKTDTRDSRVLKQIEGLKVCDGTHVGSAAWRVMCRRRHKARK